jgi:phosphoglycerate dehydrogenase-like enzyme
MSDACDTKAQAPDIVILREGTEGLDMAEYADTIRKRLPDADIRHARTPHEERIFSRYAPVITGIGIDEDLLNTTENLDLFACIFAGTDHIPIDALDAQGVTVTNASGIHAPGIAEQVIGNILVFARRLHEGWRRKQNKEWRHFQSFEFMDSTVTVVGLGSIGQAITQRLQGFDVDTIGVRYTPEKGGPTDEVIGFNGEEFHNALARTDYLIIACPLTETTRSLVDAEAIATLPPHAVIVNAARGPILDTDAVVSALQTEGLRGVALDVTDPEPLPEDHVLWTLENVLITPHTGGHTPNHWDRLADILAYNYSALEDGAELKNVILG